MHSQKTVLHINCRLSCLRLTSTAVFHKTAVLHINCRLSVCLNLVEIKHMPKTQIKLFHAGLKNNIQKRANIPKPTVTNLENISSIPVPLLNCALSGDRTCQKKLLFRLFCMNSYGSSCLGSLSEKSCCSARSSHGCQDSLSKFLGIGSCSDPIDIHYASMLFTCARSKTFGQNIAKT